MIHPKLDRNQSKLTVCTFLKQMLDWSYGVGPKVEMRLSWIAYGITLTDFLY